MIPYGRQEITPQDIDAVVEVLRSDFLTQGPVVPRFEHALANYCGARHAVAVTNATAALHLACLALDIGPGDLLWTTPITFVASANCALYCGAEVDFVDVDPKTCNLSVERLTQKLEQAKKIGKLPKILVAVHLCGQSCEMAPIHSLAVKYGFRVIEDASHAIGGTYLGEKIGIGRYSDITVFSFHPVKIITTGEGGVAVTNDPSLARKMELLRSHGITRNPAEMTQVPDGLWYYQQVDLGFNYRITEMQAALGLSQMERLDGYIERRNEIAKLYDAGFSGMPVTSLHQHPDMRSARHLYVIRLNAALEAGHRRFFESLRKRKIGVNLHYIPVYRHPYYQSLGSFVPTDFPESERYYRQAVSLPLYPALQDSDAAHVIDQVRLALEEIA